MVSQKPTKCISKSMEKSDAVSAWYTIICEVTPIIMVSLRGWLTGDAMTFATTSPVVSALFAYKRTPGGPDAVGFESSARTRSNAAKVVVDTKALKLMVS